MSLLAVGSVAFDDLETPFGRREHALGGSATYFSLSASRFHPVRIVAVVAVCANLPGYRLPPAPDYHWAQNCAPLRRGQPAKIPILPDGWILQYPGRPPR